MSSPFRTKKFETLNKEWAKKLKDSGFDDIEATETEYTIRTTTAKFAKVPLVVKEAKESYYRMADRFLNEYQFETELEKTIWEYHTNGIGCRAISKTLTKLTLAKKSNRTTVWQVLKRLQSAMKRMYVSYDEDTH